MNICIHAAVYKYPAVHIIEILSPEGVATRVRKEKSFITRTAGIAGIEIMNSFLNEQYRRFLII
jgi:hypothetical protein